MTPKEFIEKRDNGYIAGDYTPGEVYELLSEFAQQEAKAIIVRVINYELETLNRICHDPRSIDELYQTFKTTQNG